MSEREELQKVIFGYFGPTYAINASRTPEQQDRELAQAILAAGYSKKNAEAIDLVREIVEEYDLKANPNIPTYVLVDALKGEL